MKRICYLLHRFPRVTDTFIRREIISLRKAGTEVRVVSVWKPRKPETTDELLQEWSDDVGFLLPRSIFSIFGIALTLVVRSPGRFMAAFRLALATSRPGIRGLTYQMFYFVEAMLAAKVLQQWDINHVHNHFGDHSGITTMLASKLSGIGYSISFHGPHIFLDAKDAAIKEKVKHARFIRCISYFCRSQLIVLSESSNLSTYKIVHCGLELSSYQFRLPREQMCRIFCAARLAPEKGIEFLIRAMALLVGKIDVRLRLAGDGPSRLALEEITRELGVADRVNFLGNLSERDVTRELSSSDLFVLPSLAEGVPVSLMEAMAVGVPVIATNIAGTSELVEDGRTGLLVRPSDAHVLADAIIRMRLEYSLRLSAAELGRKKVADEFDIEKETAKLNTYLLESCD